MTDLRHDTADLDVDELMALFARGAGWPMPREREDWRDLLAHSSLVVFAREGGRLLGFARLLTDFVRYAHLYDVVVDPDARGRGVGTAMIRALLDHPSVVRVRTFWLGTDDAFAYYQRFGFRRDGDGHGMLLVRRDRDERLVRGGETPTPRNSGGA